MHIDAPTSRRRASFFLVNNDKKHHFARGRVSAECVHPARAIARVDTMPLRATCAAQRYRGDERVDEPHFRRRRA
jgi:hypothetical protein